MITNTGKSIIGKYLIGQSPGYASHIAVGCGAKPLPADGTLGDYSDQTSLDFEMFRVPIISRGYVTENNQTKIALTAELPSSERYDITEIGVYSSGSNPLASNYDSRTLYSFGTNENWEYHTSSATVTVSQYPTELAPSNIIDPDANGGLKAFRINANDAMFENADRQTLAERPRFLNSSVVLRGDSSYIVPNTTSGEFEIISANTDGHIHLASQSLNLDENTANDEIKLAFSLIAANTSDYTTSSSTRPDSLYIVVQFASSEIGGIASEYANFQIKLDSGDLDNGYNYFVKTAKLGGNKTGSLYTDALYKTANFNWNKVSIVRIFVCVLNDDGNVGTSPDLSKKFYVSLDAIRFENNSSLEVNPLYGLTAYSVIRNTLAGDTIGYPIAKEPNTNNFVEFRFGLDILGAT